MEQEFLPKDIKTYPEAESLQNFNAFGFNSETGAGENLPGRVIQQAIDDAIAGIGKPLTYKGGATVAQLNAGPSGLDSGWVYTCTTSGTLTAGSVEVEIGDEVAWNGTAWEKLGGEGGKAFEVTYDPRTGTADKSYTEIATAWRAGKSIVLKSVSNGGTSLYTHIGFGNSGVKFSLAYKGSDGPIIRELTVNSSNVWSDTLDEGASKDYVDGLVGKSFIITFDGTDADKTYAEILAAMSAGKVCLLYDSDWAQFAYGGMIGSGDTVYFYATRPGSEGLTCAEYNVTSSNVWTRRQVEVALKTYVVTYNSRTGTANKSYTEITTALQAGKSVVLKSISIGGENFYTHTGNGSRGVKFSLVYEGSNGPVISELTVNSSNEWSETLHEGASKDYVDGKMDAAYSFGTVAVGDDTIEATEPGDTVTLASGDGATVAIDTDEEGNKSVKIGVKLHYVTVEEP